MLGYSPPLKQLLWSREGTLHFGWAWVTGAGRGRWDEAHLEHMVEATGRGQSLKLNWGALLEQEEKAAEH